MFKGIKASKVLRVSRVFWELRVSRVFKVLKASKVLKAPRVF